MPQPDPASGPSSRRPTPPWNHLLRALRESSGVTQDGWAMRLGYSRATIQRWERGQTAPDAAAEDALVTLCTERRLFRTFERGPLGGVTLTADMLREALAQARGGDSAASTAAPVPPAIAGMVAHARRHLGVEERAAAAPVPVPPSAAPPAATGTPAPAPSQTSFIGREREVREVAELLERVRLVTLVGPGGIGKTRLAAEVLRGATAERYPGGVRLAELAPLTDPALVGAAVAGAFGVREEPGREVGETLAAALAGQPALLELDNCEHLPAASAELAGTLLRSCPTLTILATSRAPLGLAAEAVYRVPPMSVPGSPFKVPSEPDSPLESGTLNGELDRADAIRLFGERAAAAMPAFRLSAGNVETVAHICRRLDGIPLAIELAAARVRILAPEQIAARLDERFRLLGAGPETEARHRTLQAALDWSYALLTEPERSLLAWLSVFAGGCDIEAIEGVYADLSPGRPDQLFDLLTHLADKSLVVVEHRGGAARYRLLETVRAYAEERLAEAGGLADARRRHALYYLALAHQEEARLVGPEQPVAVMRLTLDIDNLRAAIGRALTDGDPDLAGEIAIRIWRFWLVSGRAGEGRDWITRTLAAGSALPRASRARLLDAAGTLAHSQGDYTESQTRHEASLEIWRELGELTGIAGAVGSLGLSLKARGDLEAATERLEEALTLWRAAGQEARVAMVLNNLAAVAMDQGDFVRADRYQEESLALKRRAGDQGGIAVSLHNLADTARYRGEYERAAVLSEESLALFRGLNLRPALAQSLQLAGLVAIRQGDLGRATALLAESLSLFDELMIRWGVPLCLEALAEVALAQGDARTAVRLLGAADGVRVEIGAPLPPADLPAVEETLAAARAALSDETFEALRAAGRALTLEQATKAGLAAAS